MLSGMGYRAVELLCKNRVEDGIYKRRFAGAGHTGDADEHSERDRDVDVFQVVLPCTDDLKEFSAALTALFRNGNFPSAAEIVSGYRGGVVDYLLRGADGDDLPAVYSGTGSYIDDVIRLHHGFLIMLDDYKTVSDVAEGFECLYQPVVVALMKPDARLVKDIEHSHERRADLRCQSDPLGFSAGQRARLS